MKHELRQLRKAIQGAIEDATLSGQITPPAMSRIQAQLKEAVITRQHRTFAVSVVELALLDAEPDWAFQTGYLENPHAVYLPSADALGFAGQLLAIAIAVGPPDRTLLYRVTVPNNLVIATT